jgi:tetratricopeptide (TPR) repeat protein
VNDFAFSRNEALELSKLHGDYSFFIDTDNELQEYNFEIDPKVDAYTFNIKTEDGTIFPRVCLINNKKNWYYKHTLHEKLFCDEQIVLDDSNCSILAIDDGVRSQNPDKRKKDIQTLITGFQNTKDPHYLFYLANTYRNDKQFSLAFKTYSQCIRLDKDTEKIYYCQLQIARMREELAHPDELIISDYIRAHTLMPQRVEALGYLSQFWEKKKCWWAMAWAANEVAGLPIPKDCYLFLETAWYDWAVLDKFATGSINNGRLQDGIDACKSLLDSNKTPESEKVRIKENMERAINVKH